MEFVQSSIEFVEIDRMRIVSCHHTKLSHENALGLIFVELLDRE